MVITTAAAATNRMAMAAVSTVMQVASFLTSPSRRARKAARCGGMVGIAGRESIKMPSSTRLRRERTHRLCAVRIARLLRRASQEGGQQHDEAARQPEQFGGNNQTHEITHAPVHWTHLQFSVAGVPSGSRFWPCREQKLRDPRWKFSGLRPDGGLSPRLPAFPRPDFDPPLRIPADQLPRTVNSGDDHDRTADRKAKVAVRAPAIDGDLGKAVRILVPEGRAGRPVAERPCPLEHAARGGEPGVGGSMGARKPVIALPKWSM